MGRDEWSVLIIGYTGIWYLEMYVQNMSARLTDFKTVKQKNFTDLKLCTTI